jgi:hypothetical protein
MIHVLKDHVNAPFVLVAFNYPISQQEDQNYEIIKHKKKTIVLLLRNILCFPCPSLSGPETMNSSQ